MAIANTNTEMTRINPLAAPTWHRLKVNDTPVRLADPADVLRASCRIEGNAGEGYWTGELSGIRTGAGEAFTNWIRNTGIEAVRIRTDENSAPVRMHIAPAETAHTAVLPVEICAEDGRQLTVIMDFTDDSANDTVNDFVNPSGDDVREAFREGTEGGKNGILAVQTRIKAGNGASVKLVQLQLTKQAGQVFTDIGVEAGENAHVQIVQLFAGGADVYAGSEVTLKGDGSSSQVFIGYQGAGKGKLDFNYNSVHIGKNTDSSMTVNGVLRDSAEKTFRGTIDFKTGSSGAVGAETEDVLLLGETVVNKTVPLILCAEEDVKGSHGASIGQLYEEMLFYLGSRGISEQKAVDLMAGSRISRIVREIGDETAEKMTREFLEIDDE
jgi:Fe-S cluster assembly scaffold protein SufB